MKDVSIETRPVGKSTSLVEWTNTNSNIQSQTPSLNLKQKGEIPDPGIRNKQATTTSNFEIAEKLKLLKSSAKFW